MSDADAVRERFQAAIKAGQVVRIVYHGGSRPGGARDVRPLWLTADSVRATDIAAATDKTFLLTKVEIADSDTPVMAPADDPQTVEEAVAPHVDELRALGWHVQMARDAARLHDYFKNGKLRKAPTVVLSFYESPPVDDDVEMTMRMEMPSMGLSFDEDAGTVTIEIGEPEVHHEVRQIPKRRSPRPYSVSGPTAETRSFGSLWKATAIFLDQARKHAPGRRA